MTDIITETSDRIRDMTIRGAGRIARAGASAMGGFAESYQGRTLDGFLADLRSAADVLVGSRPTAVSLWSGVHATMRGVESASDLEEARRTVVSNAEAFVRDSEAAVDTIARIGAKRLSDGDVVMTHCNSSAAIGVIKEAHRQGKRLKVYATESRPWRQGIITVTQLAEAGVDITLIIDSAVRHVMKDVDAVFVGADTITSNGALVNKIGTSQLALAANEARVPFNVCAETYKFSPKTVMGDMVEIEEREVTEVVRPGEIPEAVKVFNPVFDATPARYIDAYITEKGVMTPGSVYETILRMYGDWVFKE